LKLPGARVALPSPVCNPVVSYELDEDGNVAVLAGIGCDACHLARAAK